LSYEVELLALAVLLYLYDSTLLLYANEAILSFTGRRGWHVSTGWNGFHIAGRRVCMLNPFTLCRPCVKLRWNLYSPDAPGADESWSQELPKLRGIAPWSIAAAAAMFVLLPLGLFTPLGAHAVLPAITVLYGSILVASLFMRRHCPLPALTGARFAGLTLECLACPPFGVNLIRRAALLSVVREPLLCAAARLLPGSECNALREHCLATVEQELAGLDESSSERQSLEAQRGHLLAWRANP
jgi:hypothetical protein